MVHVADLGVGREPIRIGAEGGEGGTVGPAAEAVPAIPTPSISTADMAAAPSEVATAKRFRSLRGLMMSGFSF